MYGQVLRDRVNGYRAPWILNQGVGGVGGEDG